MIWDRATLTYGLKRPVREFYSVELLRSKDARGKQPSLTAKLWRSPSRSLRRSRQTREHCTRSPTLISEWGNWQKWRQGNFLQPLWHAEKAGLMRMTPTPRARLHGTKYRIQEL